MNTTIIQPAKRLSFLVLAIFSLVTFSCEKEVDPNEATNSALNGDWKVTSLRLDGVERINFDVSRFEMEFSKEGPTTGDVTWTLFYTNSTPEILEGDYTVGNEGTEVELDFGVDREFDVEIKGDDLEMNGNIDGTRWDIEAERD